jgi:NADH-quinone oxidoreductase subunit G
MPTIYIDGQKIEAESGSTVIKAAYDNGLQITHFCWHPELSVSGNCRMCLVEIGLPKRLPDGSIDIDTNGNINVNYFPKLQIACATIVSEGMHINTKVVKVVKAQEAVMEFFLINHPLDCPICDEAGQCKLQEYAYMHSAGESRFEEEKNHKPKRQEWSENIIFDAERCISCSRCIRFGQEIAKQDVLTFVQRGDHVTIKLFDGTKFDNPYSMNVIDICPVGALTSNDFRFNSRVWEMTFNDSICPGCSRGCNIKVGVRNNQILRLEPRTNIYVNKYWMCDYGRLSQYKSVNENRIIEPMIKINDKLEPTTWQAAYQYSADEFKKYKPEEIAIIISTNLTNEDYYILNKFSSDIIKCNNIFNINKIDENFADDFLKVKYLSSNFNGIEEINKYFGNSLSTIDDLIENIKNNNIKALYILDDDLSDNEKLFDVLDKLSLLIVHARNYSKVTEKADIILASSTFAEIEGTFTNIDGRVQHFTPAIVTKENLRYMGMKMSRWDKFGAPNDRWTHHEQRNCRQHWKIIQAIANLLGVNWDYKNSGEIFNEISNLIPAFSGMNYEKLDEYQGLILGKADSPEPKINNYVSYVMKPE